MSLPRISSCDQIFSLGAQHRTTTTTGVRAFARSSFREQVSRSVTLLRRTGVTLMRSQTSDQQEAGPSSSNPADAGTSQTHPQLHPHQHAVHTVYENQRWLGIGWQPPMAVLDRPAWSNDDGAAVTLDPSPPSDDSSEWELMIGPGTDAEGWQYATVFKHLQYKRAGGRASQRFGDMVRRRAWKRRDGEICGTAPDSAGTTEGGAPLSSSLSTSSSSAALAAAAAQREAEARKKAIASFLTMVYDLLGRRKFWTLLPWDPAAIFVLMKTHQKIYAELQAQALQRQLFTAESPSPPSMLREDGTLLQDLLCAAVHSRAAYGFAMQAGLISSVAAYIKLQTLQPLSFNAVGGASQEANTEAVAALAGVSPSDILVARWNNSALRPCHYVCIDRANQCVVVSVRGSLEVGDLFSDLSAHPMEAELLGVDGWVHQGILAAATYIHCTTQAALSEAASQCPGWPVLFTGHSLGGGVAALLCMLIKDSGGIDGLGPLRCITIGPAAVMSAPLAAACEEFSTSLILGSDVVPHLSYASVETLLLETSEASPVRQAAAGLGKKLCDFGQALSNVGSGLTGGGNKGGGEGSSNGKGSNGAPPTSTAAASAKKGVVSKDNDTRKWQALKDAEATARSGKSGGLADIPTIASSSSTSKPGAGIPQEVKQIPVIQLSEEDQPGRPLDMEIEEDAGPSIAHDDEEIMEIVDDSGKEEKEEKITTATASFSADATAVLDYYPGLDAGLARTAMAAANASAPQPPESEDVGYAAATGQQQQQQPGDPEHLFPPGRLLWMFPADENVDTLVEDDKSTTSEKASEKASDKTTTSDRATTSDKNKSKNKGDKASDFLDPSVAAKVESAWDSAWEGKPPHAEGKEEEVEAPRNKDVPGAGAVNVEEAAAEAAETSADKDSGGDTQQQPNPAAKRIPVVADAERGTFERMLVLPDMLNDHLPDRYLEALQQL